MTGELIAETRKLHGDTQERLAEKLGVSVATIRSWEQGRSLPPSDKVIKICKLYHVSADYLLGLTRGLSVPDGAAASAADQRGAGGGAGV